MARFSSRRAMCCREPASLTGNNIGPKGELASRALTVRLEVNRADPRTGNSRITTRSGGPRRIAVRS